MSSETRAENAISEATVARRGTYAGLFLVTLSTLAYQILLTRIFSVTMWYHFAFLAVSIAMLGITVGAIAVYLFPGHFAREQVHRRMMQYSFAFALTIALSLLAHLSVPVHTDGSARAVFSIVFTCLVVAVPFTVSGVCVALALTRFQGQVSTLYAADLVGAAIGCVSVIWLLSVTDGPTAVFAVALLANIGSLCFATGSQGGVTRRLALASAVGLAAFVIGHTWLVHQQSPLVRISWAKSTTGPRKNPRPLYERWNSHSRIQVSGEPGIASAPFGWSFSPALPRNLEIRQLDLDIDSSAYTVITAFDGSLDPLQFLKYDITNLAHYLRRDADVLVVGAGGGRDVLSALVFDQAAVVEVEVNEDILEIVHEVYGEFSGHVDRHPKVRVVNDEARSFIARSPDRFDIIQISLIDSWAATGAGAFVLAEHSLYTVEAWKIFLEHLTPGGLLTVTRYFFPQNPGAAYRLTALAARALAELGVSSPRDHIALVRLAPGPRAPGSMSTILVGADPLSERDLDTLGQVIRELGFELVLSSEYAASEVFERVSSGRELEDFYARFPLKIDPPTDDTPFFFHMLRLRDIFDSGLRNDQGLASFNMRAVFILGVLLLTVFSLTLLCIFVPLALRSNLGRVREAAPWLLIFAGIGAGFMMIEISQMERLIVFLGHPVYALSVVLFSLLCASGLGSFSTARLSERELPRAGALRFIMLLAVLAGFGILTPIVTELFRGSETPVRIATSVATLFPIGFLMGMPFPMGMKAASIASEARDLTPWLWGINGASGVLASVLAIAIALSAGISTSFWVGFGCYVAATLAFSWTVRRPQRS